MGRSSKFDVGFRVHAVELTRMLRRPRCQIADEIMISDTWLSKWMAQSENDRAPEYLSVSDKAELDQLRSEKREWILELEILKKAIASWVKAFCGSPGQLPDLVHHGGQGFL